MPKIKLEPKYDWIEANSLEALELDINNINELNHLNKPELNVLMEIGTGFFLEAVEMFTNVPGLLFVTVPSTALFLSKFFKRLNRRAFILKKDRLTNIFNSNLDKALASVIEVINETKLKSKALVGKHLLEYDSKDAAILAMIEKGISEEKLELVEKEYLINYQECSRNVAYFNDRTFKAERISARIHFEEDDKNKTNEILLTFGYRNFFNSKKEAEPIMLSLKVSPISMSKGFLPNTDKLNKLKIKRTGKEDIIKIWKFEKENFYKYGFIRDKDKKDIEQIFDEFIECKRHEMRSLEKYINSKIDNGFLNKSKLKNKIDDIGV